MHIVGFDITSYIFGVISCLAFLFLIALIAANKERRKKHDR